MTSAFLEAPVLRGDHVVLEPLAPEHEAELAEAVREGELWRSWVTRIPPPDGMGAEIRGASPSTRLGRWCRGPCATRGPVERSG